MLDLILELLYYYCVITFYTSIFLFLLGILYGVKIGYSNAKYKINNTSIYNRYYISYYNCVKEYIYSITKSSLMFGLPLLLLGIILPILLIIISIKKIYFLTKN